MSEGQFDKLVDEYGNIVDRATYFVKIYLGTLLVNTCVRQI